MNTLSYPEETPEEFRVGSVFAMELSLLGQSFMAMNGSGNIPFTEPTSFMIGCQSQEEIDDLWGKLSVHLNKERCGWCQDKFGVSWQMVPKNLPGLLFSSDPLKTQRIQALFQTMGKIGIKALKEASQE